MVWNPLGAFLGLAGKTRGKIPDRLAPESHRKKSLGVFSGPCKKCKGSREVQCWACGGRGVYTIWSSTRACPCCTAKDGSTTKKLMTLQGGEVEVELPPPGRKACPGCSEVWFVRHPSFS